MLAWLSSLSVFVKSIALEHKKKRLCCLADLFNSVCWKNCSEAWERRLCWLGRAVFQCLLKASLCSAGKVTMLAWQNYLSVFSKSITLKRVKDNYACLVKLFINVCWKYRFESQERRLYLLGRADYHTNWSSVSPWTNRHTVPYQLVICVTT